MDGPRFHSRLAMPALLAALAESPVVLIHGPRQCGKTTLACAVAEARGYEYFTFDDAVTLQAATDDPVGFLADLPDRVVLDEVQRVPGLFLSIKAAVDRERRSGRFLMTGSSNVLTIPALADSLAGRMEILRLHPLAQCELAGVRPGFLDALFAGRFPVRAYRRLGARLATTIVAGGYPAALARSGQRRRSLWYRDYIESLVQRDVRELGRIASLDVLPRLLAVAAGQSARLFNLTELAASFQLSRPTIRDYVTLLERVFLVESLPPWHSNRLSRLVKTPKLHVTDTGVASALLGYDDESLWKDRDAFGRLLETFVVQELRREASGRDDDLRFHHYRDRDGLEVDLVVERSGRALAGIEVKASATVTATDFRALRRLREVEPERFTAGVVLYDGESCVGFGDGMFAVPVCSLWSADQPGRRKR